MAPNILSSCFATPPKIGKPERGPALVTSFFSTETGKGIHGTGLASVCLSNGIPPELTAPFTCRETLL